MGQLVLWVLELCKFFEEKFGYIANEVLTYFKRQLVLFLAELFVVALGGKAQLSKMIDNAHTVLFHLVDALHKLVSISLQY